MLAFMAGPQNNVYKLNFLSSFVVHRNLSLEVEEEPASRTSPASAPISGGCERTSLPEENGNNPEEATATIEDNSAAMEVENGNNEPEKEFPLCLVIGWDSWQDAASFQDLLTQIEDSGKRG
jgi:hypothetical protein